MAESADSLRSTLERILSEIDVLRNVTADAEEVQAQLEISQKQVMRLYLFASERTLLPSWIGVPQNPDIESQLLIIWEQLAFAFERLFPHRLAHIADIAKRRVPIIGQDRSMNLVPPARARKWVDHAAQLVVILIEHLLPPDAAPADLDRLIQQSWYTADRAAQLLSYSRGNITRLVADATLNGKRVDGRLYINPIDVHAHPKYRGKEGDELAVSNEVPVSEEIKYECCSCENVLTAPPGKPPARCPKCNGYSTLLRQTPKR